jgi:two-component system CheB/CheR fusion protein
MTEQQEISFPVVGIGALAGGLEALSELLTALTPETGMAWIVVQHLDPTHQSMLVELLGAKTRLAVSEAHDCEQILHDHLYVIPPNATMTFAHGSLRLQARHRRAAAHGGRHTVSVVSPGLGY